MEGTDVITTEGTLLLNLTTIATRDDDDFLRGFPGKNSPYTAVQAILIALVLGSIIVGTVIGNILVCVAVFLVKKLRRPCNYLLVSLAVSDLCVALLVMPMALLYEISGNWSFGAIMCDLWVSFDVLSCTASILNLCMISVDRFCAITKPLKYGVKRTPRRMIIYVSLVWLGAACISLPPLLIMGNEHTYSETGPSHCVVCQNFFYQIYATLGSFYIPLFVMIQEANSSKVGVCKMDINNFFDWVDFTSQHKLKKNSPKPYLHDFVSVQFTRREQILKYKNDFSAEFKELNFLNAKAMKTKLSKPKARIQCKGISAERKENLIAKLKPIMPANRFAFSKSLNVSNNNDDDD